MEKNGKFAPGSPGHDESESVGHTHGRDTALPGSTPGVGTSRKIVLGPENVKAREWLRRMVEAKRELVDRLKDELWPASKKL